jgi:hypothetical protein
MRLTTLTVALSLIVPAAAANAQAQASAPAATQQATPPAKEKKVCKEEVSTGSIMPKRICKTPEEWAAMQGANGSVPDQLRNWQQNGRNVSGNR